MKWLFVRFESKAGIGNNAIAVDESGRIRWVADDYNSMDEFFREPGRIFFLEEIEYKGDAFPVYGFTLVTPDVPDGTATVFQSRVKCTHCGAEYWATWLFQHYGKCPCCGNNSLDDE